MDTFASRLKQFIEAEGMTSTQFADMCKVPRPSLSQILSGRNKKISDILIGMIYSAFPNLNVLWLMFGEGGMYKVPTEPDATGHAGAIYRAPTGQPVSELAGSGSAGAMYHAPTGPSSAPDASLDIDGRGAIQRARDERGTVPDAQGNFLDERGTGPNAQVPVRNEKGAPQGSDVQNAQSRVEMSFENPTDAVNRADAAFRGKENALTHPQNSPTSRMNTRVSEDLRIADLQTQLDDLRKNMRRVSHITVYYDDFTFETFVPKGR